MNVSLAPVESDFNITITGGAGSTEHYGASWSADTCLYLYYYGWTVKPTNVRIEYPVITNRWKSAAGKLVEKFDVELNIP